MNNAWLLVRAVRGPLLLMTLGGLLLLHRFEDISFTKTWPVLLIVLGLMKLFERVALHSVDKPADGPVAGGGPGL